jgi:uncharacterized repeat protein (TIGR01451 family)
MGSDAGCSGSGQTATCSFISRGVNTAGDFQVFARAVSTGTGAAQADISANEFDPDTSNNTSSTTITVTPSTTAELSIGVSVSPSSAYPGDTLNYYVSYANNGPGVATNTKITDDLPAGLAFVPSQSDPTCGVDANNIVTCSLPTLWPRSVADLTIATQPQASGTYTNTVSIGSDQTDPNPSNNSASVTSQVLPSAGVSVINAETVATWPSRCSLTILFISSVSVANASFIQNHLRTWTDGSAPRDRGVALPVSKQVVATI